MVAMTESTDYELLDAGDGRRLERFGGIVVDRPAPAAEEPAHANRGVWTAADLRFDRGRGWNGKAPPDWVTTLDGLNFELHPTESGQVGLFPEQVLGWPWLGDQARDRHRAEVLHLFAHTGATTLVLAREGARVTHVDASRPSLAWARRNAEMSGLSDRPIRWVVDDALAYTRREARRGRRYAGIVLDPPSFGHGPGGRRWELEDSLPELLGACAEVAAADAFVLLTAHTIGLDADALADALWAAFGVPKATETGELALEAASGAVLRLGQAARIIRR
jgi:23S rRNA (cytosine1962-C5)-methyltransferase